VLGGVVAGAWLLRSGETDKPVASVEVPQEPAVASSQTALEVLQASPENKPFADLIEPLMPAAASAQKVVVFAPSATAIQKFTVDTALSLTKFANYHVVVSDADVSVTDGAKLKTSCTCETRRAMITYFVNLPTLQMARCTLSTAYYLLSRCFLYKSGRLVTMFTLGKNRWINFMCLIESTV
jgi:hypothetical protein